jgi:signal peptidase I
VSRLIIFEMDTISRRPHKSSKREAQSAGKEWLNSVVWAVMAALVIRWLLFTAFVIPTPSMENTLLVGDYLFVSRLHYGTTTPITPLQIPLTHQKIWGTDIPSYLDWIQLPPWRLPGFSEVQRGDVVVFNLPVEHPNLLAQYQTILPDLHAYPVDLRTNYIKRCVALPGEIFEIKESQVVTNGIVWANPVRMQAEYFVATDRAVNEVNVFKKNGVWEYSRFFDNSDTSAADASASGYHIYTTPEIAQRLSTLDFVKYVNPVRWNKGVKQIGIYPQTAKMHWNIDHFGPFKIPQRGMEIMLTPENVALYADVILWHEGNQGISREADQLMQSGQVLKSYTFKQDYYFMMGDNRHQSADSRFWGFVPKDHIVGKAVFVWMSLDPDPIRLLDKIRWSRIFRVIH